MPEIQNLSQRLSALQEVWAGVSTEAPAVFDEMPPDGDYSATVSRFDFFEMKNPPNHAFLKVEYKIALDDHYAGRKVESVHNLEDPERLSYTKSALSTLGLDLDHYDQLEAHLGDLLDVPVSITIKTSERLDREGNPYRNVYVNRRLGDPIVSDVPAAFTAPPSSDDDSSVPF